MAHRFVYNYELKVIPSVPDNAGRPNSPDEKCANTDNRAGPSRNYPPPRSLNTRVMESFVMTMKAWFDSWLVKSFRARGSGRNPPPKCSHCHPTRGEAEGGSNNKKRTRDDQGSDRDESDYEGDEGDMNPDRKRVKRDGAGARNLGCPFFKHNPALHQRYQSCSRQGFPSVHRVKQHLYKRHRLPEFSCFRCFESFPDSASLANHSRSMTLCEIREAPVTEGLSSQQEAELKKRSKNAHSETQKWVDVYLLLFPGTALQDVPSPYIVPEDEHEIAPVLKPCKSLRCILRDDYKDLEQFLFCQSRRHLIKQLQEADGHLEDMLRHPEKAKVVEIIPKVLIGLLRDFHERNSNLGRNDMVAGLASTSRDDRDIIYQPDLDALAQQLPPDLSIAKLDPFSTLATPTIPEDIVSSLDWLAQSPDIDFDSFCNPPPALGHTDWDYKHDAAFGAGNLLPAYGVDCAPALGSLFGNCNLPSPDVSPMNESIKSTSSMSALSSGSAFSASSDGHHIQSCFDTDIESLLSSVSVD